MDYIKLAKENEDLCIEMRRQLHKIPELELNLPKTVAYVKKMLDEFKIDYIELVNGNAIVATIKGKEDGKCFAIRADMDALPVKEETGLPFSSEHEGKMHACGHDSHTAVALTAAKILSENRDKFNGYVKFLFQPGEEIPGGAEPMIREGAMENPHVDYVVGIHNGDFLKEANGIYGFKENELMAAMDRFSITVNGKGGHGARPDAAIDPIAISAEIISGLQKIISREISPVDNGVISVCKIEGGFTQNIIPDQVHMLGTARSLSEDVRDTIERRIGEISKGIAATYGATADYKYDRFYPVVNNDPEVTRKMRAITEELFPGNTVTIEKPTMGGEDFAFYEQKAPGTFIFCSNAKAHSDGVVYSNHNSKFDLDESTFYKSVAIFVAGALGFLNRGNNDIK